MTVDRCGPGSPDERDREAESRDSRADSRDESAAVRDEKAQNRDVDAHSRDESADAGHHTEADRLWTAEQRDAGAARRAALAEFREQAAADQAATLGSLSGEELGRLWAQAEADRRAAAQDRRQAAAEREITRNYLDDILVDRRAAAEDRRAAAEDRRAAAEDRRAAEQDRWAGSGARQQTAVERAQRNDSQPKIAAGSRPKTTSPPATPAPADFVDEAAHSAPAAPQRFAAVTAQHRLDAVQHSIELVAAVSRTELSLARTLQELAEGRADDAARRRLGLAEEAIRGSRIADGQGKRLQRLARRLAEHTELAALRKNLQHAGTVLTDLARAEEALATTLAGLAHYRGSAVAAERQRLSREAQVAAETALRRIEALQQLVRDPVIASPATGHTRQCRGEPGGPHPGLAG